MRCHSLFAFLSAKFVCIPDPSVAVSAPKKARKVRSAIRPGIQGTQIPSFNRFTADCHNVSLLSFELFRQLSLSHLSFADNILPLYDLHVSYCFTVTSPVKLSSNQWDLNNYLFSEMLSPSCRPVTVTTSERRREKVEEFLLS